MDLILEIPTKEEDVLRKRPDHQRLEAAILGMHQITVQPDLAIADAMRQATLYYFVEEKVKLSRTFISRNVIPEPVTTTEVIAGLHQQEERPPQDQAALQDTQLIIVHPVQETDVVTRYVLSQKS